MKYVVICYSVHARAIASHDTFDTQEEAENFLQEDANNTYDEEVNSASETEKDDIELEVEDDFAFLSSCGGTYEWTWEIIQV